MVHSINKGEYSRLTHSRSCPKHHLPIYPRIQITVHLKNNNSIFRKVNIRSVLIHRPGTGAATLAVSRKFGIRRVHYARHRFVSWQEHLFPHCFCTFSISSFPFHFVLSENLKNNFNASSGKMANAHTLQLKHKPHFELPENSVPRLRSAIEKPTLWWWDLHMCSWTPTTGHILDWKTKCKAYLEIFG